MLWFKIGLIVLIGLSVASNIAKANGWRPEPSAAGTYAFCAVLDTLMVIGIWVWL